MRLNFRRISAYLFLLVIVLYVITGYGITRYQIVEKLTLGLLSKPLSFKIHQTLIYPLVIFLFIHLYYSSGIFNFLKNYRNKSEQATSTKLG